MSKGTLTYTIQQAQELPIDQNNPNQKIRQKKKKTKKMMNKNEK